MTAALTAPRIRRFRVQKFCGGHADAQGRCSWRRPSGHLPVSCGSSRGGHVPQLHRSRQPLDRGAGAQAAARHQQCGDGAAPLGILLELRDCPACGRLGCPALCTADHARGCDPFVVVGDLRLRPRHRTGDAVRVADAAWPRGKRDLPDQCADFRRARAGAPARPLQQRDDGRTGDGTHCREHCLAP